MMTIEITEAADSADQICAASKKLTVATAESCTGGLVAGALTDMPGSSAVVDRGFVTYSNAAKQQMLGVPAATLKRYGAVSRADRRGDGARRARPDARSISRCRSPALPDPTAARAEKPVGLVHFAAASRDGTSMHRGQAL